MACSYNRLHHIVSIVAPFNVIAGYFNAVVPSNIDWKSDMILYTKNWQDGVTWVYVNIRNVLNAHALESIFGLRYLVNGEEISGPTIDRMCCA